MEQDSAVLHQLTLVGRQPPAFAQRQQHIVHRPGLQLVGQFDPVGEDLIAIGIDQPDIALSLNDAGLAVPRDLVSSDRLITPAQHDIAKHADLFAVVIIAGPVSFELDLPIWFGDYDNIFWLRAERFLGR